MDKECISLARLARHPWTFLITRSDKRLEYTDFASWYFLMSARYRLRSLVLVAFVYLLIEWKALEPAWLRISIEPGSSIHSTISFWFCGISVAVFIPKKISSAPSQVHELNFKFIGNNNMLEGVKLGCISFIFLVWTVEKQWLQHPVVSVLKFCSRWRNVPSHNVYRNTQFDSLHELPCKDEICYRKVSSSWFGFWLDGPCSGNNWYDNWICNYYSQSIWFSYWMITELVLCWIKLMFYCTLNNHLINHRNFISPALTGCCGSSSFTASLFGPKDRRMLSDCCI